MIEEDSQLIYAAMHIMPTIIIPVMQQLKQDIAVDRWIAAVPSFIVETNTSASL